MPTGHSSSDSSELPSYRDGGGWRRSRTVRIKSKTPKEPWKKPQWLIHWKRTLLIVIGVLGTLAALYFGYHQLRKIQSRRLTAMAVSYLKENKVPEAKMSLQTALRLSPSNPQALRLQARLNQVQGQGGESLSSYSQLARSGKMSLGDLRPYASLAERQGDHVLADRLASAASKNSPLLGHLIKADLLVIRKQPDIAAEELREAIKEGSKEGSKENPAAVDQARMDLVKALSIHHPDDPPEQIQKNQQEAFALIQELGSRPNELGAASLVTAIRSGIVPSAELPVWITRLRAHPKVTPEMLLFADAVTIQSDPAQKDAVIAAMISRVKSAPPKERFAAAQLLIEMQDPSDAAGLIKSDEALQSAASFALWMQAKRMSGHDDEVLKALSQSGNPLPAHVRDLDRAALLRKLHGDNEAKAAYEMAYNDHVLHGTNDKERLETVVMLSATGEQGLAEQGEKFLLADSSASEARLHTLSDGMRYTHDSAKLLKLLELASASPSLATNLKLQNDLDYQRLLLGQSVDLEHLRARVAGNPNEFAFRVTEAVALMKAGKNSEALGVLENIEADVDATKLPPSQMAVLAAAMAANGDQKKASALMSLCRGDFLTKEEIALVKEAFANQSAASTPGSFDTKTTGAGASRASKTSPSPR
jgi:hypothetical protein